MPDGGGGAPLPPVPCNGCTACCRGDRIRLRPFEDPARWHTEEIDGQTYLAHGADGNCVYLKDDGCSIHGDQPWLCRQADCRVLYLALSYQERKARVRADPHYRAIFKAAQARLG